MLNPALTTLGDEEGVINQADQDVHMDQSLENRIRERAYEIWIAHGCVHGQADQHWLAAEREILAASTAALASKSVPKKKRRSPARSKIARTLALAG
jgi:fructose/tagatose bisphosphate aldolase